MKYLNLSVVILFIHLTFIPSINGQQSEVEFNSSSSAPHLTLKETEDSDFVRLWFQNNTADKWAFNAKPKAGSSDNDNILSEPIIFAWNAEQKFAIGGDGTVRINKKYTLPTTKGTQGQVLTITDDTNTKNSITDWVTPTSSDCTPVGTLIDQLPFEISKSGIYYLEDTLVISSVSSGILLVNDSINVTINFNGFGINGNDIGEHGILGSPGSEVNVYNGFVKDWTLDGISVGGIVQNVVVENCRHGIEILVQTGTVKIVLL